MKTKTYSFIQDPAHGWLRVKTAELDSLGLLDKISGYSYVSGSGKSVYLEEDADLALFLQAKQTQFSELPVTVRHSEKPSFVRSLKSYTMPTVSIDTI
jgi:hypothetical protein